MPQSIAQVWLHIVFSTKSRKAHLQNEDLRSEMFRVLAHEVKESGCVSASVGGFVDHVHLLVGLGRTITIAEVVGHIKAKTSYWVKEAKGGVDTFQWQSGYGAFSVSHSNRDGVDKYIRDQQEHHQTMTFQEEFRLLCKKHSVEVDERYVWD